MRKKAKYGWTATRTMTHRRFSKQVMSSTNGGRLIAWHVYCGAPASKAMHCQYQCLWFTCLPPASVCQIRCRLIQTRPHSDHRLADLLYNLSVFEGLVFARSPIKIYHLSEGVELRLMQTQPARRCITSSRELALMQFIASRSIFEARSHKGIKYCRQSSHPSLDGLIQAEQVLDSDLAAQQLPALLKVT